MQGFNMGRYYPPDATNPPTFNTSHPLGARASKISKGILTVRFELPFAVWCQHCTPPAIVGQGVRFNAEKKKVGNYYSTPIWSFRMKHTACGGWWEIRTDPKNAKYVVVEGAVARDYGDGKGDMGGEGELKMLTEEEREKRREDAFARLEGKVEDKGVERENKKRVEELYEASEVWRDPYDVNARLRRGFREKRKVWKKEDKYKEVMQDKFSLGIDIVDETDGDRARARMIEFGGDMVGKETWKPLFGGKKEQDRNVAPVSKTKRLKTEIKAEKSRQSLQQTLVGNTKAAIDPFMMNGTTTKTKPTFSVLKRKRDTQTGTDNNTSSTNAIPPGIDEIHPPTPRKPVPIGALVGYDSD